MSDSKQKEAEVILFNKGKRKIQYSEGFFLPQKKITVGKEEAERLLKLFDAELLEIGEGEDPTAKNERENAIIKLLRDENAQLKAKIKELEEGVDDSGEEKKDPEAKVEVDLDKLDRGQLEQFIIETDLDVKVTSNMRDDTVRNKIVEALSKKD